MPQPEVYSAAHSEFVFAAGANLLRHWKQDVMYLTALPPLNWTILS